MTNPMLWIFMPNDNESSFLLDGVIPMLKQGNMGGALIIGYRGGAVVFSVDAIDAVLDAGISPANICIRLDGDMPEAKDAGTALRELNRICGYAYSKGIRLFQFFNEPNWVDANGNVRTPLANYANRFFAFALAFRARWPEARIVTPGLVRNPGMPDNDVRSDVAWYHMFQSIQQHFDVVGAHVYFEPSSVNMGTWGRSYRTWHDWLPDKPILITEWACQNYIGDYALRARISAQWLQGVLQDSYVIGAACFISRSKDGGWQQWEYDDKLLAALAAVKPIEGGQTMTTLAEQFPAVHAAWVAAGGSDEADFKSYLMAIGSLPTTVADYDNLGDKIKSHVQELVLIGKKLPKV